MKSAAYRGLSGPDGTIGHTIAVAVRAIFRTRAAIRKTVPVIKEAKPTIKTLCLLNGLPLSSHGQLQLTDTPSSRPIRAVATIAGRRLRSSHVTPHSQGVRHRDGRQMPRVLQGSAATTTRSKRSAGTRAQSGALRSEPSRTICEAGGRNPRRLQRPRKPPLLDPQLVPQMGSQTVLIA